jgi:hypothetical protein
MECQYCNKILSSISSLNYHRKNTKSCVELQGQNIDKKVECEYCNKVLSSKSSLKRHMVICKNKYKFIEDELSYAKKHIELLTNTIKELRADKSDLQERYDNLSLTAVKRPTTSTKNIQINNYIQKMEPLRLDDIKHSIPMLTLDHHVKGAEGYAEFALEFPFKDKIVCVDVTRNKIKYKNDDGDVIEDIGFQKMMIKLCEALKDRSFNLCQEHYEKLTQEFTEKEMEEFNCMETAMAITRYANGRENEFCNKVIKLISKGSKII